MVKKFVLFFALQVLSNFLWAFWVLPAIGEQGSPDQLIRWIAIQILLPLLLCILLSRGRRYALWILVLYGGTILLFGVGVFGWAMMGESTPVSVYVVCLLFFIISFGVIFRSLKELNIGQKPRDYGLDE